MSFRYECTAGGLRPEDEWAIAVSTLQLAQLETISIVGAGRGRRGREPKHLFRLFRLFRLISLQHYTASRIPYPRFEPK